MEISRQKNAKRTLFVRMLITYIVLTIVTTTLIGASSMFIYERFYIKTVNENVRQNIASNHMNLVKQVNSIKDDVVGSIFMQQYGLVPQILNEDLGMDDYVDIKNIYDYLNELVLRNSSNINGVHIYYKNNNMLISSKYGLKLLDSHNGQGIELDWLELMLLEEVHHRWLYSREVGFTTSTTSLTESNYSYITTYPMLQSSKEAQIMICIDFDEDSLKDKLNTTSNSVNYIVNGDGQVITSTNLEATNAIDDRDFVGDEGYFLHEIDGEGYIVSYIREPENKWLLVNQQPTGGLYRTMNTIKLTMLGIYLLITAIGIMTSFMVASKLYNPVKDLLAMIRRYDNDDGMAIGGEFSHIGSVINGLGGHVSQLQDTIDSSRGLLVSKLIGDMSRKSDLTDEVLAERMDFLGIQLDKSEFMFMKVEIGFLDKSELLPSQCQIIKFRLMNEISHLSDENNILLATDYEDNSLLVLINTDFSLEAFKKGKINELTRIESIFSAEVFIRIFLMDSVQDMRYLYRSYRQLDQLKQMVFFMPSKQVLTSEDLASEDYQKDIHRSVLDKFEQSLYSGGEEALDEVSVVIDEILKQTYTTGQKQEALMNLIGIVAKYIKDISLNSHDIMDENIYDIFNNLEDINMFHRWMVDVIGKVHGLLNDTNSNGSHDTVTKVKLFIEEHLAEDLSLSQVASKVYLSPQYLSALFKKEVGVNFSTYLQKLRIEKARELLLSTEMKVEDVGKKVGYQTSHYFIKKFKEHIGLTPRQYRNRHAKL